MTNEPLHERVAAAVRHQYEIEREIGRGGMSVVYLARDVRLNRQVALKVLPPDLAYDQAVRARFTREAQTAAQLQHPHIVPIHDVGEQDGIAYLVMAYVSGGNLAGLLAHEPQQPIDEARRLLSEISDALAFAHARGVIHRDIKPDNILLDRETGRAMVTDFGIARAMEAGTRLTATGNAVGTPAYMSPEQAVGEREIDGRSDIYSLGIVAYQMLTGRVPFSAANSMALLMKHVSERPRPIAELRPETPKAMREAVERALLKDPQDRWPTAAALREALTTGSSPAAAWRPEPKEPVRYRSPKRGTPVAGDVPPPTPPDAVRPELVMEAPHLAGFTPEQRADIRLWNGHIHLLDRIKLARWYGWFTLATWPTGVGLVAATGDFAPAILAPLVPIFLSRKLWKRCKSLRAAGLKLYRVFLMPRAKWALPSPAPKPKEAALRKLAPRDVLESPQGTAIRRAAEDRAAILDIIKQLPKAERAMLPDVEPTANALVERVAHLAQAHNRLDASIDSRLIQELDGRIAEVSGADTESPEGKQRLALLRRQRATMDDLVQRRAALARQLDSAGLALRNLKLDLIKLRSSGLQSALSDVTSATQEARALSREIGAVLDAAAEVRSL